LTVHREERGSDVSFVAAITHVVYGTACHDVTTPDGLWDIVIQRHAGQVTVLQTGLITSPIALDYLEGDEYLSISFKPGVFMPRLPGARMVDKAVVRPLTTRRTFALDSDELEIPSFENAEGLVDRLVDRDIIVCDEIVADVAEGGQEGLSPRSVQRHFVHALGLSPKQLAQIQRAKRAVALLRAGRAIVDVAMDLGYADQPHMTRSLKRFIGRTPGEISSSGRENHPTEHL
jgi:AraC-like DNA-binding protein